jgi:hypothetical protein
VITEKTTKDTLKTEATKAFVLPLGHLSGNALFSPTKSCVVVFLSAGPDPGQYSFDNDINNDKEELCQISAKTAPPRVCEGI